mmetsp:Transcript_85542/g.228830  ORF Transcript_85542/g.228830 Transcript_85542/m.228830 type:complete len:299 (+) Transcript_85542:345-1241(+)
MHTDKLFTGHRRWHGHIERPPQRCADFHQPKPPAGVEARNRASAPRSPWTQTNKLNRLSAGTIVDLPLVGFQHHPPPTKPFLLRRPTVDTDPHPVMSAQQVPCTALTPRDAHRPELRSSTSLARPHRTSTTSLRRTPPTETSRRGGGPQQSLCAALTPHAHRSELLLAGQGSAPSTTHPWPGRLAPGDSPPATWCCAGARQSPRAINIERLSVGKRCGQRNGLLQVEPGHLRHRERPGDEPGSAALRHHGVDDLGHHRVREAGAQHEDHCGVRPQGSVRDVPRDEIQLSAGVRQSPGL